MINFMKNLGLAGSALAQMGVEERRDASVFGKPTSAAQETTQSPTQDRSLVSRLRPKWWSQCIVDDLSIPPDCLTATYLDERIPTHKKLTGSRIMLKESEPRVHEGGVNRNPFSKQSLQTISPG